MLPAEFARPFIRTVPLHARLVPLGAVLLAALALAPTAFADEATNTDRVRAAGIPKAVLLEVFTGAWASFAPDGRAVRDEITDALGPQVIAVDVHAADGMDIDSGIEEAFGVAFYPDGMVDRALFDGEVEEPISRGSWQSNALERLAMQPPVYLGLSSTINTQSVVVTVAANFVAEWTGDIRMVAMLVEDPVIGVGVGFDQVNSFDDTVGHPFEGAGDPIQGYDHPAVLRDISSPAGIAGTIPPTASSGSVYEEEFTLSLSGVGGGSLSIVGFVANFGGGGIGERDVLNVFSLPIGESGTQLDVFEDGFDSGDTCQWSAVTGACPSLRGRQDSSAGTSAPRTQR